MPLDLKNLLSFFKNDEDIIKLKKQNILQQLNIFELKNMSKHLIERKFKAGEIIYKENYPHVVLYMIKAGQVQIYLEKPDNDYIFAVLNEHEHFGEIGLFNDSNRITSAKAITDCVLYAISKYDFIRFMSKYPGTGIKILFKLAEGISSDVVKYIKNDHQ